MAYANASNVSNCSSSDDSQEGDNYKPVEVPIKNAIERLKKFPLFPSSAKQHPAKGARKTELITSTPVNTRNNARKKNASLSFPPGTSSPDASQDNVVSSSLNEFINIFKGLAFHIENFGTILSRLEVNVQSTVNKITKLEEEMAATRSRCQMLEQKLEVLEGRNEHLFERINATNPQPVAAEPSTQNNMHDTFQGQLDHLHQSRRCNDLILSGRLIETRVTRELDRGATHVHDLCVDIIARIHGLEDCARYIERCRRLGGEHPKLLVTFNSNSYRAKVFSHFFQIKKKPFFINENLIPSRAKLFHELRLLRKQKKEFY